MRKILQILAILVLTFSCQIKKVIQTDYSESAAKPIELIKSKVLDHEIVKLEIEIINSHGGRYQLNANIEKSNDTIKISTNINDMAGIKSDTLLKFSIEEFVDKLDYEIQYSENQLVFAGNYQSITIKYRDVKKDFYTRKAFGLMSLLREGKSNIIKKE